MGIGTSPLRRYGYSHVGEPALNYGRKAILNNNLSLTATISLNGIEMM